MDHLVRPAPVRLAWIAAAAVIFIIGYAFSLEMNYVEGDDASSLIYHMMGRDAGIQPPYASYHAFADVLLGILPPEQGVLLSAAMSATALACIIMYVCILALVFRWLDIQSPSQRIVVGVLMLFAIPELFYIGIIYTPALIALAFILPAHLLVLRAFDQPSLARWAGLALVSVLLFGMGAATRWDMVLYGGVIFIDLMRSGYVRLRSDRPAFIRHGILAVLWGGFALASWVMVIYLSGYSLDDILGIASWSQNWQRGPSLTTLATMQPLLTPFVVVTFVVGLFTLLRRRDSLLIVLAVSILLIAPWIGTGIPKAMLTAFPALIAVCAAGIQFVLSLPNALVRRLSLGLGIILILLPWVVGVRLHLGESAWGPGFELQDYDRAEAGTRFQVVLFQPGTAVPTSEGPRALFGHYGAIFGGGWRGVIQTQSRETAHIIDTALAEQLPLVILRGSGSYYVSEIAARGFTTVDPASENRRLFVHAQDGAQLELIYPAEEENILADASLPSRVIIIGYPSTLRALYLRSPEKMQKIARIAAIYSTLPE